VTWFRYRVYGDGGFARYSIVWAAVTVHIIQGWLLIKDDSAAYVTSISHVINWLHLTPDQLGVIYITIAILAFLGWLLFPMGSVRRLVMASFQQGFLMLAAWGAITAMLNSQFADGVVRSSEFISADQIGIVTVAFWHTVAIFNGRIRILLRS
jgi:hypothetical protein